MALDTKNCSLERRRKAGQGPERGPEPEREQEQQQARCCLLGFRGWKAAKVSPETDLWHLVDLGDQPDDVSRVVEVSKEPVLAETLKTRIYFGHPASANHLVVSLA